jgi:hypothetical protein
VTIQGLGAALLVDANQNAGFVITDDANVTFNDLSISNAKSSNDGGTLRVTSGNVALNRVLIRDSLSLGNGGAVSIAAGKLNIQDSTIIRGTTIDPANTAAVGRSGGALYIGGGTFVIDRTDFEGNTTKGDGGSIHANGGFLDVRYSSISGSSGRATGGAISITANTNVSIENSSITNNFSDGFGGAIYSRSTGTVQVINSTIASNYSNTSGGGIYLGYGTLTSANNTIAANRSLLQGGGVIIAVDPSTASKATFYSTIVAQNFYGTQDPIRKTPITLIPSDVQGQIESASAKNLIGFSTGMTGISNGDANRNIVGGAAGIDPLFSPSGFPSLVSNGILKTLPILATSPAIDAGFNPSVAASDNRGGPFVRSSGAGVDIGAYEVQAEIPLVVTTNLDRNNPSISLSDLSLREALRVAGNGAANITFAPSVSGKTINLTLGTLLVSSPVNIIGPGANVLAIDGNGKNTVLLSTYGSLAISNITIQNGFAGPGGLVNVGGGVYSLNSLALDGVIVTANSSSSDAGGVYANTLTLKNSTISSNRASKSGGGVFINTSLTLSNSTISGNQAGSDGGGIIVSQSFATVGIKNSTITLNQADSDNTGGGSGGGVFLTPTTASDQREVIVSSIIAGNSVGTTGSAPDLSGKAKASTLLLGNTTGFTPDTGSDSATIYTASPLLGPLANNGGPTPTHALLAGSPALDKGANPDALLSDQRGTGLRSFGAATDIGAFEFGTVTATKPGSSVTSEFAIGLDQGGGSVTLYNQNQTKRFTVTPFDGFTGGIRTASADFNNDGITDLVVGTGPGIVTQVKILSGLDQTVLFTISPFEAAFTRGVFVAAGDINGDGIPDLAISPDEGGGPRVRIFSGQGYGQLADYFGIADPAFRGGARVTLGDMNSDGKAEVIVAAGFGGGPRVTIWDGAGVLASSGNPGPSVSRSNFFAYEPALNNGAYVASGDINGDGIADVVFGAGPGGGPRVRIFDGARLIAGGFETLDSIPNSQFANFFADVPTSSSGVRVTVKNLDNDGKDDLLTGVGTGGRANAFSATNFNSVLFFVDAVPGSPGFSGGVFVG